MTSKELLVGIPAVLGAVTSAFAGNQGGVVLALVLILGLAWQLRGCDRNHKKALAETAKVKAQNQRLVLTVVQLVNAVNELAPPGAELIDAEVLDDVLQGQPVMPFKVRKGPGRRKSDKGRKDGDDDAAGGAGNVSG